MILKAANQTIQFGLKYALSTIGWIIVLVSTALAFLLGDTMPMEELSFGNSGACRCADFLAQQSRKEYFSQYRFGFVGFLQYGNRFAGGYPFVCAFVCFRSVGWYSCQRIQ